MWATLITIFKALLKALPALLAEVQRLRCQDCSTEEYAYVLVRVKREKIQALAEEEVQPRGSL